MVVRSGVRISLHWLVSSDNAGLGGCSSPPEGGLGAGHIPGHLLGRDHPVLHGAHWAAAGRRLQAPRPRHGGGGVPRTGTGSTLPLHFGNVLVDWIILHSPNMFGLMTMCQELMWRNRVIYEVFRPAWLMVAALGTVNSVISALRPQVHQPETQQIEACSQVLTSISINIQYSQYWEGSWNLDAC